MITTTTVTTFTTHSSGKNFRTDTYVRTGTNNTATTRTTGTGTGTTNINLTNMTGTGTFNTGTSVDNFSKTTDTLSGAAITSSITKVTAATLLSTFNVIHPYDTFPSFTTALNTKISQLFGDDLRSNLTWRTQVSKCENSLRPQFDINIIFCCNDFLRWFLLRLFSSSFCVRPLKKRLMFS